MARVARWRFLFREDRGEIGAPEWRRGAAMIAAPMIVMTAAWFWLQPYANRDLSQRPFIDPMAILAFVYLLVFALAILIAGASCYNLCAKRWRDLGKPPGLAGLPLFAALVDGAAHWLQPRVSEVMPWWLVVLCDVALVAILIWQVTELALRARQSS